MKIFFTIFYSVLSVIAVCQNKYQPEKYKLTTAEIDASINKIPVTDGKILFDQIIYCDSTQTKMRLFVKIRQWFVENFRDSRNVLEVADSLNGVFTAKINFEYGKESAWVIRSGHINFTLNIAIKDSKLRYQLSALTANGIDGYSSFENWDYSEILEKYNHESGKKKAKYRDYLGFATEMAYFIDGSLKDAAKHGSINDF